MGNLKDRFVATRPSLCSNRDQTWFFMCSPSPEGDVENQGPSSRVSASDKGAWLPLMHLKICLIICFDLKSILYFVVFVVLKFRSFVVSMY